VLRAPIESTLTAAIGVKNHRLGRATLVAGGTQSIGDQLGAQVIGRGPADHPARGDVDDGG
jgi:hypothetical protein